MTRRVKGEDGQWSHDKVPVPDAIKDYNIFMGGVDLSDALIQYYSVHSKTMRWHKTFFCHFLHIAVVNAYILYQHLPVGEGETHMTHKRFSEVLMKEMVNEAKVLVATTAPHPTLSTTCMPLYFWTTPLMTAEGVFSVRPRSNRRRRRRSARGRSPRRRM